MYNTDLLSIHDCLLSGLIFVLAARTIEKVKMPKQYTRYQSMKYSYEMLEHDNDLCQIKGLTSSFYIIRSHLQKGFDILRSWKMLVGRLNWSILLNCTVT